MARFYHLVDHSDRLKALTEAKRVLRCGGVVLAFAITRYAGSIYGLTRGYVFDPVYRAMVTGELKTGHRHSPPDWSNTFKNAYSHHPDQIQEELTEVGLLHEETLGVVGPVWLVPDLDESWDDESKREVLLEMARLHEHESVLSPRIMAVARKVDVNA